MSILRRHGRWAAALVISSALLAWLCSDIDGRAVLRVVHDANAVWLIAALCATATLPLAAALRWQAIARVLPGAAVGFRDAFRVVLMTSTLNALLPAKAGDLTKAFTLSRTSGIARGFGAVAIERLVDVFVLGALAAAAATMAHFDWNIVAGLGLMLFTVLAFLAIGTGFALRLPVRASWKGPIHDVADASRRWIRHPRAVALTFAGSALSWGGGGFIVWLLMQAYGARAPTDVVIAAYPIAVLAGLLPFTMSGVGTRDGAFFALLGAYAREEELLPMTLTYTVLVYWVLALWGLPAVIACAANRSKRDVATSTEQVAAAVCDSPSTSVTANHTRRTVGGVQRV